MRIFPNSQIVLLQAKVCMIWYNIFSHKKISNEIQGPNVFFFTLLGMLGNYDYEPTCIVTIKIVTMQIMVMIFSCDSSSICPHVGPSVCPSVCPSVLPSVRPSVCEQRVSRSVPKFIDVITGLFDSLVVEFSS